MGVLSKKQNKTKNNKNGEDRKKGMEEKKKAQKLCPITYLRP